MGWIMSTRDPSKKRIYNFYKGSNSYVLYTDEGGPDNTRDSWSWQDKGLWEARDECILYYNDEGKAKVINTATLGTLSCNSGGSRFWSSTGMIGPAYGQGGTYVSWAHVYHLGAAGLTFDQSQLQTILTACEQAGAVESSNIGATVNIADQPPNMISPGSSTNSTALFGLNRVPGAFVQTTYTVPDCPIIYPGDLCFLHIRIVSFASASYTVVLFNLAADDVPVEDAAKKYIWQYQADHRWHLVRPYMIKSSTGWMNVEDVHQWPI